MSNRVARLKIITVLYTVMIFLAIIWGGYVRGLGAGLGCGEDWPLCNGYLIPPNLFTDFFVFMEYFHRIIAFLTGWIALGATIYILLYFRHDRKILLSLLLVDALLFTQIMIGMLVVSTRLDPVLSATHLAFATATFGASIILTSFAFRK